MVTVPTGEAGHADTFTVIATVTGEPAPVPVLVDVAVDAKVMPAADPPIRIAGAKETEAFTVGLG